MVTKKIGNVEMVSLTDGFGSGRPTEIFPGSSHEVWLKEYPELLDPNGLILPRYGSLALRSTGKLIVVDTGNGPPSGRLMGDMDSKGIRRDDVDLVVITHLHGDHVGWNVTDHYPTFPRARYLISKGDWDYWTDRGMEPNVKDQVVPLGDLGLLELIEGDYSITGELTTVPTPGHTPGHFSIIVSSAGEKGFILGDVAHSPAQVCHTDWGPTFDVDPRLAEDTRRKIFDRLEAEGSLVSAGHFPDSGFGRIIREAGRRYWQIV